MISMNLRNIAVLNVIGAGFSCIISGIFKSATMNLMENFNLTKKSRTL